MTFKNYKNSNNASSKLIADISASSTTALITSGDETLFPSEFPFLLTIEKLNSDGSVVLREIVKVTAKNQNSLIIVRGAGTCVQDDTASQRTQGNTAHSFSSGDRISLYRTSEQTKDIQDELQTKLSIAEYQSGNYVYGASTTGNDDYAITLPFAPTAYAVGQVFRFLAGTANTGPATLNVNGLGAIDIKKNHDVALDTGDIEAGQIVEVAYDGTNFQMNSQTATIVDMKDIKTLSFSGLKAGQTLTEGDIVQISDHFDPSVATEASAYGGIAGLKGAIGFVANGDTIQDLQIKFSIIEGTTPTAITVNLESDNNGAPSGTVLATADLLDYPIKGNIDISSIMTPYFNNAVYGAGGNNYCYFGGGNRGKTRCFYGKTNVMNITSSSTHVLSRLIINSDSSGASAYGYTVSGSTILNLLGLTGNQFGSFLYVDQDFKFMFIFIQSQLSIYKLGFNAPSTGEITDFTVLGSRTLASVGIDVNTASLHTQIAFSDDGMYLYTMDKTENDNGASYVNAYSLSAPYDLTGATAIGDAWQPSSNNYVHGIRYMSLGNGKNYVVAYAYRGLYAREINSDGTIGTTNYTIASQVEYPGSSNNGICVWNFANGGASVVLLYHDSSHDYTYFYTLGEAFFNDPITLDFSLGTAVSTTEGQTYWLTFYPTGGSVENLMNIYSYGGEENTSLSTYTDSWSSVSNRSPYLKGSGVSGTYIVKQFETDLPFGTYGIIDNDYQAFAGARFVNMGISNHNTGLTPGKKYYMSGGKLSKTGGDGTQYLGTAISSTDLLIGTM